MAERALTRKKGLGAYYTNPAVVDFLVAWGIEMAPGVVMDPSCGDGRFLSAAAARGATGLIGCDLDPEAVAATSYATASLAVPTALHQGDFFELDPARIGPVDLVAGNPPFIRYQQFAGESRARALASALRVGARLGRLAASWAPFLLHALQFLRPQGAMAMAMVVPAELAQTTYGIETLRALCANFARIRLIAFRYNWFEEVQQETFLLMAEGRGGRCAAAELVPLERIDDLARLALSETAASVPMDVGARLGRAFLTPRARALLDQLAALPATMALGDLGSIANGYVTGANAVFHCTAAEGGERGLPADWLLPVARNSRSLRGLGFEANDVAAAERRGVAHHLIWPGDEDLFTAASTARRRALKALIAAGEGAGIPARYKCRVRDPWWRVPGLIRPGLLLPYMIGSEPHAAVNRCGALYPNSLHGIRLASPAIAEHLALGLLTSLSLLSLELEGRSYGGGILKLEPTGLARVRVVLPTCPEPELRAYLAEADRLIRDGAFPAASHLADQWILADQLGLAEADIAELQAARATLLERRTMRRHGGTRPGPRVEVGRSSHATAPCRPVQLCPE
ncbi:type I restriction-modification system methyltransferase subunit [Thioflavicoccus mobilis 8321]|uniref:site-specific DNA-methyltransferase (adenine-specific) n=1 Tax=Thioflavicoccus mobilis 8321 TaxID=765912 RepID=L0H1N3_9GAMM|nr:class I SAM-dependent methyltransferase [Thioflavicoccus mobilis]AGA92136.1 type I restriction-modification system methyltransferase subunit [Thioflavicoccus mobilis 8321]